jgi:hypothetical protein
LSELSEPLLRALDLGDEAAAEMITAKPALLDEARIHLPYLRSRAAAPATSDDIRLIVGRRFALYPQPERSEGEWREWWADYLEALKAIPAEAIEQAMRQWIATADSVQLPKPGQLASLAASQVTPQLRAVAVFSKAAQLAREREDLARRGVLFQAPEISLKRMPKTPEDREFVRQTAAEMREALDEKLFERRRNNESGKSQGVVGADGLTELMCRRMGIVFRPAGSVEEEEPQEVDDLDEVSDFGPPP